MKLSDLLVYDDIVIQCHDNPDADAIASGYALHWYLTKMGKSPRFIYRGYNEIKKSNLRIMIEDLKIPISYEPDFDKAGISDAGNDNSVDALSVPDAVVYVDCQAGERNVTFTEAKTIAVIDHHQISHELPKMSEVRSNIGSCSTIIWDMIRDEGLDISSDRRLSTALYYGLFTDTNSLSEVSHPLDRDMVDSLVYSKAIVTKMRNSNISLEELKITGIAITGYDYHDDNRYIIIQAAECDPNILGVISDFVLETEGVDVCLAYTVLSTQVKISVRSCTKEVHADELAAYLAAGIGGGGGHMYKAGGTLNIDSTIDVNALLNERMKAYYEHYEIIYAENTVISRDGMKRYQKRQQELGYVKATDLFPVKTLMRVRTLEGDVDVTVEDGVYLMIGIEGEVYPINSEKFDRSYKDLKKPYSRQFEYAPCVYNAFTGERKEMMELASACVSTGISIICAKPLDRNVKLFTMWDEEKYYSGRPGDFIAVREDDDHDTYIIRDTLFPQLYEEI